MPGAQPPAKYLCLLLGMQRKGTRGGNSSAKAQKATGEATGGATFSFGSASTLYPLRISSEACGGARAQGHKEGATFAFGVCYAQAPVGATFAFGSATHLMPGAQPPAKYICLLLATCALFLLSNATYARCASATFAFGYATQRHKGTLARALRAQGHKQCEST
jgi:hypothetical protein